MMSDDSMNNGFQRLETYLNEKDLDAAQESALREAQDKDVALKNVEGAYRDLMALIDKELRQMWSHVQEVEELDSKIEDLRGSEEFQRELEKIEEGFDEVPRMLELLQDRDEAKSKVVDNTGLATFVATNLSRELHPIIDRQFAFTQAGEFFDNFEQALERHESVVKKQREESEDLIQKLVEAKLDPIRDRLDKLEGDG